MGYCYFNPNPANARVGDCTVRAISRATGQDWTETYIGLCLQGLLMSDMPSANHVWGSYLRSHGFERHSIEHCPDCYSVSDFCEEHRCGVYVLALGGHVVCCEDAAYFDTWDCGNEIVLYYWEKVK